jgi:hypothetical protein
VKVVDSSIRVNPTEPLRFMTEVYGEANIELTPAYLILAEAAIGKS